MELDLTRAREEVAKGLGNVVQWMRSPIPAKSRVELFEALAEAVDQNKISGDDIAMMLDTTEQCHLYAVLMGKQKASKAVKSEW